jgi:glycerophosphoryl diester phosphodiesterase
MKSILIVGLNSFQELGKNLMSHLELRGIETGFWVVNTKDELKRALTFPISGIHTDRPEQMKKWLIELEEESGK